MLYFSFSRHVRLYNIYLVWLFSCFFCQYLKEIWICRL